MKIIPIKRKNANYDSLRDLLAEFERGEVSSFVGIAMRKKDDELWIYTCDTEQERASHRVGLAQVLSQHLVDEMLNK